MIMCCVPRPAPKRCSARAAALASFSIAAGKPEARRQMVAESRGRRAGCSPRRPPGRGAGRSSRGCRRRSRATPSSEQLVDRGVELFAAAAPRSRAGSGGRCASRRRRPRRGRRRGASSHRGRQRSHGGRPSSGGYHNPSPWPARTSHTASTRGVGPRGRSVTSPSRRRPARPRRATPTYKGPKPARKPRRWRRWVLLVLVGLILLVLVWAVLGYLAFRSGIKDANKRLDPRAARALTPQDGLMLSNPSNILVLGADVGSKSAARASRGARTRSS